MNLDSREANVRFTPVADIRIDANAHPRHADLMTRQVFIATALAVAVCLAWLGWEGWFYIKRGYSFGVRLAGEPDSIFHIDFPPWRAAVHVSLWLAAMASIVAYVAGHRWACTAACLILAATFANGVYDVVHYGIIASPTSIWTVLLLLLFTLLTRFAPLSARARARA